MQKTNWPPKRQWVWLPVMSGWSRPSHSWDLGSRLHVFFGLFLGWESCRNYWNLQDFICIGKIFFVYNYRHIFEKTICNSHHIHAVEMTITFKTLFPSCGSNWDFISLVASTYKVWWCLVFSGPRSTPPTSLTIRILAQPFWDESFALEKPDLSPVPWYFIVFLIVYRLGWVRNTPMGFVELKGWVG